MSGTQWYYTALAVLIPFILSLQVLLYRYLTRGRIDNRSLRYAIDNLPMGIAFYRGDGLLLLANDTIRSLCKRVTGSGLVNAHVFHARLLELASGTDANAGTHADEFVLTLGQEVWSIRRKEVNPDGVSVYQLTAYETTELYEKERELSGQLAHLREAEERLRDYRNSVDALAGNEAWLSAKERIHDSLGQVLLSTRYYLTERDVLIGSGDLFAMWNKTIGELTNSVAAAPERENATSIIKPLEDAANALGARLVTEGSFPSDDIRITRLVLSCTRVCLINAVRHGAADEVTLAFDDTAGPGEVCFRIMNNGRRDADGVREGGGLKNMRANVEKEGGTVCYETDPRFAVVVRVPVRAAGRKN